MLTKSLLEKLNTNGFNFLPKRQQYPVTDAKVQRDRGIALLFLDQDTRKGG
jgi:hypothetical protein